MDFHSLTRRELQALCKKNKIPANMTNVAMADALQSLEFVDGIEEVLNTCESDVANSSMESPGKSEALMSVPRTSRRTTQRKTIKIESETLQTSTRSHCRTRGAVVRGVDEAKNDMLETPAMPTTRRRAAATTSVRAKLESVMKECEPKEKIGDQVEEEKKDVPKTPAAALTSQRKEVKAKSSIRQVYSTRRSVRIAGKQEDEKSGTLTFDAVTEETDEGLEVNSEQSVHKNEELDKSGIDLKSFESLNIKDESDTVSGQDSITLVQNEIDMEDGVQQDSGNDLVVVALDTKAKEGSEEGALGHNNNGSEAVFGEELTDESEIDAEAKKEKDEEEDFATENDGDEDDGAECNADVAGKEELTGEVEAKVSASRQKCLTNMQASVDSLELNLFEQFNGEVEAKVSGSQQKSLTNMEDAGQEEPMEEYEVSAANVDSVAHGLEVAGEEEPMEEHDVDRTKANVDAPADALEVAGEEEPMEEHDVDHSEAYVDAPAHDVDHSEANVDAPADSLEVAGEEGPMEEHDVDYSEANVDAPADGLEVAGEEEPMEESEVAYAEATADTAHALPSRASLIPNATPGPVFTLALDPMQSPSETSLENSSAATSIGQIVVSDNKENLVCMKETKSTANNNKQSLENLSLRKLTKMLKDLQITKDPSGKEAAASSRSALQKIPENRLTSEDKN